MAVPALAQAPPHGNPIQDLAAALKLDPAALGECIGMPGGAPQGDNAMAPPPDGNAMAGPEAGGPGGPGGPPKMDETKLLSCAQEQNPAITADEVNAALPKPPAQ